MKVKCLLVAAAAAMLCFGANAQAKFISGDMGLNINMGFGQFYADDFDWNTGGLNVDASQISLGASFEYIFLEGLIKGKASIGGGAQAGFGFGHYDFESGEYKEKVNYSRIRLATRGVFHFAALDELDTYGGVTLGIDMNKASSKDNDTKISHSHNKPAIYPFVGARYFLADGVGVNLEMSYDRFAYLSAGLTLKF